MTSEGVKMLLQISSYTVPGTHKSRKRRGRRWWAKTRGRRLESWRKQSFRLKYYLALEKNMHLGGIGALTQKWPAKWRSRSGGIRKMCWWGGQPQGMHFARITCTGNDWERAASSALFFLPKAEKAAKASFYSPNYARQWEKAEKRQVYMRLSRRCALAMSSKGGGRTTAKSHRVQWMDRGK